MGDHRAYRERLRQWKEDFGQVGEPPKLPKVPTWLELWFELQRWSGHLLVDGGLMDQPAFSWEMIDLAGMIYQSLMRES